MVQRMGILVCLAGLWISTAAAQQGTLTVPARLVAYLDLIVYNGKIVTMDDHSLNNSFGKVVQAMAVRGDRIQFLGASEEMLALAGPQTRKIDLRGRPVIPGMIDSHNHLHNGAVGYWSRQNVAKVDQIARRFSVAGQTYQDLAKGIELVIKEQMARPSPGQWAMINLPAGSTGVGIGIPC